MTTENTSVKAVTFTLLKFYMNDSEENRGIIPWKIKTGRNGILHVRPNHAAQLREMGLRELAEVGRVRHGKVDSGTHIELPSKRFFTAGSFLEMMKPNGLSIISVSRKVEPMRRNNKNFERHVVTVGIGWGTPAELEPVVLQSVVKLCNMTWSECHIWDNAEPRHGGVPTVDTINLTGPTEHPPENTLSLDQDSNLVLLTIGDAKLTAQIPAEKLPNYIKQ